MLLTVLGRVAQFILAMAMMRVSTTLLPPSEVGRMSLYVSATLFAGMFLITPVGMFINRRLHGWEASGVLRCYLRYYFAYLLAVAAIISGGLIGLSELDLIDFHPAAAWIFLLVGGTLVFNTVYLTFVPSLNLLGHRNWFIGLTLATVASGFVLATLLSYLVSPSAEYWLLGLLLGQVIVALLSARIFFNRVKAQTAPIRRPSPAQLRVLYGFGWPLAVAAGMMWLQSQSYRFFMGDALGLAQLGLFVAGYGISAGLIAGFEAVLTTYFQPLFYRRVGSGDGAVQGEAWSAYAAAILPSAVLFGLFLAAAAPDLVRLLLAPQYASAAQYVLWGALAETARLATGVYGLVAHAKMNTRLLLLPNAAGVTVAALAMLLLMPRFGAHGVGAALALSSLTVLAGSVLLARAQLVTSLRANALLLCLAAGAGVIAYASLVRSVVGPGQWTYFGAMVVPGLMFVFLEFWLLRPFIASGMKTDE